MLLKYLPDGKENKLRSLIGDGLLVICVPYFCSYHFLQFTAERITIKLNINSFKIDNYLVILAAVSFHFHSVSGKLARFTAVS